MKKAIICAALALMVVLSMTGVAAAAEDTKPCKVKYSMEESFTWTVPAKLTVGASVSSQNLGVNAENCYIKGGNTVKINASSMNRWEVKTSGQPSSAQYVYCLKKDGTVIPTHSSDTDVYEVRWNATPQLCVLTADWADSVTAPTKAGTYTDTLTFTASSKP